MAFLGRFASAKHLASVAKAGDSYFTRTRTPLTWLISKRSFRRAGETQQPHSSVEDTPRMMKAARVVEFGRPLDLKTEIPVPEPGHGEVLVKLTMSGVCHSDVHMRNGDLSFRPTLPIVPGHEGVGRICKLGPGVSHLQLGDRVMCACFCGACGSCVDCWSGWETACPKVELAGVTRDGTLAQYVLAWENYLCPIPDNVKDEDAAPINCAGVTTYKALKVSKAKPGDWVIIFGAAGGLGFYALQYAKAMGFRVIAVDVGKDKTGYLEYMGFTAVDGSDVNNVDKKVKQLTGLGAHAAIILVPSGKLCSQALQMLRKRGTLVLVGLMPDKMEFDTVPAVVGMNTIVGSLVGTRSDLAEALEFVSSGRVVSHSTVKNFSEVNEILDDLQNGKITGRTVVKIPHPGD